MVAGDGLPGGDMTPACGAHGRRGTGGPRALSRAKQETQGSGHWEGVPLPLLAALSFRFGLGYRLVGGGGRLFGVLPLAAAEP